MEASVFRFALHSLAPRKVADAVSGSAIWDKSRLRLYPGVIDVLKALSGKAHVGVIANQSAGARDRLVHYGVAELFDTVWSSYDVGMQKPDPRIFTDALASLGAAHRSVWMVGDRIDNDIAPANALGWNTIRVSQGYNRHQSPRSESEQPGSTIESIAELPVRAIVDS